MSVRHAEVARRRLDRHGGHVAPTGGRKRPSARRRMTSRQRHDYLDLALAGSRSHRVVPARDGRRRQADPRGRFDRLERPRLLRSLAGRPVGHRSPLEIRRRNPRSAVNAGADWVGVIATGSSCAGAAPVLTTPPAVPQPDAVPGAAAVRPGIPSQRALALVPLVEPIRAAGSGFPPYPDNLWGETGYAAMANRDTRALVRGAVPGRRPLTVPTAVGENGQGIAALGQARATRGARPGAPTRRPCSRPRRSRASRGGRGRPTASAWW